MINRGQIQYAILGLVVVSIIVSGASLAVLSGSISGVKKNVNNLADELSSQLDKIEQDISAIGPGQEQPPGDNEKPPSEGEEFPAYASGIDWNSPKPWKDRLTEMEVLDKVPVEEWSQYQPKLKDAMNAQYPNNGPCAVGYTLPDGWEEAVGDVEELTYFNSGGLSHDSATVTLLSRFEKKTGIHVNAQPLGLESILLKTTSTMTSKNASPQVIQNFPDVNLLHFGKAGWLEKLNWFWPEKLQELYPPGYIANVSTPAGNFYNSGMIAYKTTGLFYRPSVLKEVTGSSDPPQTMKELIDVSRQISEQTNMYGLALPNKNYKYVGNYLNALLASQGEDYIEDGKFYPKGEPYKKAFTTYVNFVKEGGCPEASFGWSWTDAPEVFARGNAAMVIAGMTYASTWEQNPSDAIKGDWAVLKTPPLEEGMDPSTTISASSAWGINPYASKEQKAAAAILLDMMRSKAHAFNELVIEGNEAWMESVYELPVAKERVNAIEMRKKMAMTGMPQILPVNGSEILKLQREYVYKAATGDMSIEEAISAVQDQISQYQ
ncbi:hypothetical protein AKJ38_04270 [candidate division MSBL1 archaeon SCGC-AAA259I14]|uniref:ABC transporter substrate-binding protein n=1 Tax=candidate division MSBL1 archaeon SCGC-AAA259I14 TaxID=1698268 RepID=A0A133UNY3_9EURY|nr:hypothetical protein AKJ38_04270 [candidate division MSBL1 archaeon SCGC-AAA259I14]